MKRYCEINKKSFHIKDNPQIAYKFIHVIVFGFTNKINPLFFFISLFHAKIGFLGFEIAKIYFSLLLAIFVYPACCFFEEINDGSYDDSKMYFRIYITNHDRILCIGS